MRREWGVALLVLGLAGCDLLMTEPVERGSRITVSFQIDGAPAGGVADAFAKVRTVGVRFTRPDGATRDTAFLVVPVDGSIRVPVSLEVEERVDALGIDAFLAFPQGVLFQGSSVVRIEPGVPTSARIPVVPVPAGVTADRDLLSIPNVGDVRFLRSAVLFASLDSIPGAPRSWFSDDPSVITVTPEGEAEAVGFGQTRLVVQHGNFADTVLAGLAVVDTVLVTPEPIPTLLVGEVLQASATLTDGQGNELFGRPVDWRTVDAGIVSVDATGLLTGLQPGITELVVSSGQAVTRLPVEVVLAASLGPSGAP